jgi:SAM-dependent methyltransferase
MSSTFTPVGKTWLARLGTLRQVVRHEVVASQLTERLRPDAPRVLDVGCGQGTQALRLARLGYEMTALDSSERMLAELGHALAEEPAKVRDRVQIVRADATGLAGTFSPGCFDLVLCHGLLMYFPDPGPLLTDLARMLAPGEKPIFPRRYAGRARWARAELVCGPDGQKQPCRRRRASPEDRSRRCGNSGLACAGRPAPRKRKDPARAERAGLALAERPAPYARRDRRKA